MTTVHTRRKRALIVGVANANSIATAAVQAYLNDGAEVLAATSPMMVERASKALGPDIRVFPCDVEGKDDDIIQLVESVREVWPEGVDYLVHAVAFSDKNELEGSIFNTSRENYLRTQDISAYSFLALCKHFAPLMREGGGVATYTFAASRFRSPNYNTMAMAKAALETLVMYIAFDPLYGPRHIKVIGISAGPIKTLSSMGVGGFRNSLKMGAMRSATGDNVTAEDVGQATVTLLKTPGLTGRVIDIDNSIVSAGMGAGDEEYAYHMANK